MITLELIYKEYVEKINYIAPRGYRFDDWDVDFTWTTLRVHQEEYFLVQHIRTLNNSITLELENYQKYENEKNNSINYYTLDIEKPKANINLHYFFSFIEFSVGISTDNKTFISSVIYEDRNYDRFLSSKITLAIKSFF